jgi:hypothetical protein
MDVAFHKFKAEVDQLPEQERDVRWGAILEALDETDDEDDIKPASSLRTPLKAINKARRQFADLVSLPVCPLSCVLTDLFVGGWILHHGRYAHTRGDTLHRGRSQGACGVMCIYWVQCRQTIVRHPRGQSQTAYQ